MSWRDPLELGAAGDGKRLDTAAIQKAIDQAFQQGGGVVVLRAGRTFLSGSLVLKSNVELHIERGAILKCSPKWEDVTERWPGGPELPTHLDSIHSGTFIAAHRGTTNIAITGGGLIDCSGRQYAGTDVGTSYDIINERPFLLFFVGCHNVILRETTFSNSPFWTVRLSGCEDVVIHGARILGDMKMRNCDGLDIDRCRRVRVSDCDIQCPDDAISIKGTREFGDLGPCEDIVVTNCTLVSKSSALVVGCDANSPLRNIIFSNCIIRNSNRGLSVNLSEDSIYENILFTDCYVETRVHSEEWWGRGEPIYVSCTPWQDKIGSVSNVRFVNIIARSECGAYIAADELGQVSNILLRDVRIELGKWYTPQTPEEKVREPKGQPGCYDRRPTSGERQVYEPEEGVAGFHLENIKDARLEGCEVVWKGASEKWMGSALWARGCEGLRKTDVFGPAGWSGRSKAVDVE